MFAGVLFCTSVFAQVTFNKKPTYHHAYYLFLVSSPNGCEACYVPLLITQDSLEEIAKGKAEATCVWITTYERDSVWSNDRTIGLPAGDVSPAERKLRAKGREYRYQEISSQEVVHLLANPMGTIPISRPALPTSFVGKNTPTFTELISMFQTVK